MTAEKEVNIRLTDKELKYLISCGVALMQNVPENSLTTYCGFTSKEIIEISKKLRQVADEHGIDI